jgi:hypothetical protein
VLTNITDSVDVEVGIDEVDRDNIVHELRVTEFNRSIDFSHDNPDFFTSL